ncbi:MAG: DUF3467 domain-containing protein [Anaerolineae bacterium]|nr:DUF3467 domain-containing protein [Anaerolineae bacterium]
MPKESEKPSKSTKKPRQPKPPSLELPEDLSPQYVNLVRIAHTPSEMIYDFSRMLPGEKRPKVESRILMSPLSAKLFLRALTENLTRYEATFGEINIPQKSSLADQLFRSQPPDPPTEEE